MIGIVVVTFETLADSLLDVSRRIIGQARAVTPFGVQWDDDVERVRNRLAELIDEVDQGEGVLLLTDIFGATPSSVATAFYRPGKVEVVHGVNLPMIIKAMTLPGHIQVAEAARRLEQSGRHAIAVAGQLG